MIESLTQLTRRRLTSLLGLALDGNRLEAVVVKRTNGSLHVQQTMAATLALSPLTGDPELVGREIRNHLDQAGIRERNCVFCIPLSWVLTLQTNVPDLPEEDVASYLDIEAERGFHTGLENLQIAKSRSGGSGADRVATLVAIPRAHLATLQSVFRAAQLRPVSFSLGITAVAGGAEPSAGNSLNMLLGSQGADLLLRANGGIAALRSFEGAMEGEGAGRHIDADAVAREIRITLGQLPARIAETLRAVRICGRGEPARLFLREITPRLSAMALQPELLPVASSAKFDPAPPADFMQSPALALAAARLMGTETEIELLPPKVHPWQQFLSSKVSSRKLVWAGAGAGALAACVGLAFLIQQIQLMRLQSQWKATEPRVTEVQNAMDQIRKYQAWSDRSFKALRIMKRVAEAFPEEGYVSAKTLEIRDLALVTCSGNARDNQAYLKLLDQLRQAEEVGKLKTDQVRGQAPLQFTLNFEWEGGEPNAN